MYTIFSPLSDHQQRWYNVRDSVLTEKVKHYPYDVQIKFGNVVFYEDTYKKWCKTDTNPRGEWITFTEKYRYSFENSEILTHIFDWLDDNIKNLYYFDWLFFDHILFIDKNDAIMFKIWLSSLNS